MPIRTGTPRRLAASAFASAALALPLPFPAPPQGQASQPAPTPAEREAQALRPLLRAIARHEAGPAGLDAVNRGIAGDSLGGIPGLKVSTLTVGAVLQLQARGAVFAVGAYQFIPSTLSGAVEAAGVPLSRRFDAATQEALALHLLEVKRPEVVAYVRGAGDLEPAALALAKEWASIGTPRAAGDAARRGESFYGTVGGNVATLPPAEVEALLAKARAGILPGTTEPTP